MNRIYYRVSTWGKILAKIAQILVHENPGDNPEVRYIEFLSMDSGSELSPEQDPVVWKILNLGHFALNSAD